MDQEVRCFGLVLNFILNSSADMDEKSFKCSEKQRFEQSHDNGDDSICC